MKMNLKRCQFSLILLWILKLSSVHTEMFTALADMEQLLETEAVLITNLENYIEMQEAKLEFFKRKLFEYQREHSEAAEDGLAYLSNPVNAYLLTKRLTVDWQELENVMNYNLEQNFISNITKYRDKFPSEEDLSGAAVALLRLQDTYHLDTHKVAEGELAGVQFTTAMTAHDCFELGRQSYMLHDYYHTVLWMQEALERLDTETNRTVKKDDILDYLAYSTFKQGNTFEALQMTNELLEIVPSHERALGNKVFYERELEKAEKSKALRGDSGSEDVPAAEFDATLLNSTTTKIDPTKYDSSEKALYEMGCRGELGRTAADLAKLKCRYVFNNSPFLKIAPLKLEEANLHPYIVVYHDVMYDNEIEIIKQLAKPRFKRATVQNHKTGELEVAQYRISKSAWLTESMDPVIETVSKRLADMTGLSMETAEELQVVNYGIGGHYEPHFDFARKDEANAFKSLGTGNRIATVLFYMSDVPQGGATVFPHIRVTLQPKKGTAAFWHNLYKDGQGDYLTRHAACPVLTGTKWVSNRWIHERGQEFNRPCGLEPDSPPDD